MMSFKIFITTLFVTFTTGSPPGPAVILTVFYLLALNLAGLLSMGIDKQRARKHRWRIPEKTLFLIAALGGSAGSILGMLLFRHKTRHLSFRLGMPAILALQIMVGWAICH